MALSILGNAFPPMAVLVTAPILARALDVDGRGDLAAATAPFMLAIAIATLGLPDAVTNVLARRSFFRAITWFALASSLVGTGALSVLLVWLASPVLTQGGSPGLATLMTVATLATVPGLLVALLRGTAAGLHMWGVVATERILNGSLRILGIVGLALAEQLTLFSATLVTVLGPVLAGFAYVRLVSKSSYESRELRPTPARRAFAYGTRAWLGSVAGILLMRIDQLLILPLSGPAQLGLYAVAVNVSEVPLIINSATREVMFSSDAAQRDNERAGLAARATFIACVICALGVLAPIGWWLPLVFGSEFVGAIPIALLAAVAVVVGVPGSIAGATLSARGRPELRSFSILLACLINLLLLFVLVPSFGGIGAAAATLVGNLVSSNLCITFAVKHHRFRWTDFYGVRPGDFVSLWQALSRVVGRG
ncbi:oligosaccharide flippase family protein [Microbacterium mcarthurae (nom. nud.)]|uniref:Oligosaccharide flippase family protein n=1 Tax=Microbacterium mcarthurae TaxID=3035918 RepID=A0ABW9GH25_9MICO